MCVWQTPVWVVERGALCGCTSVGVVMVTTPEMVPRRVWYFAAWRIDWRIVFDDWNEIGDHFFLLTQVLRSRIFNLHLPIQVIDEKFAITGVNHLLPAQRKLAVFAF